MRLQKYEGEDVRIIDVDGRVFEGYISDYIYPEDNVPEEVEGIIMKPFRGHPLHGQLIEFHEEEIKSIEIIE